MSHFHCLVLLTEESVRLIGCVNVSLWSLANFVCCFWAGGVWWVFSKYSCLFFYFLKIIFWNFVPLFSDRAAEEWTGNKGEREGLSRNKEPQCGIKPAAAPPRTQPLYVGRVFYRLSHGAPLKTAVYCGLKMS